MARAVKDDLLHSFRFHATASGTPGGDRFLGKSAITEGTAEAGFTSVGTPSGTIDAVEYREGQYIYTRKFPGYPTMDDITMSRGVIINDTEFHNWFLVVAEGTGEYRADIEIRHYHRGRAPSLGEDLTQPLPGRPEASFVPGPEGLQLAAEQYKTYILREAFPVGHKVATDLDGTAAEVAISDLTVSYERFDIVPTDSSGVV